MQNTQEKTVQTGAVTETRSIARQLAREIRPEELEVAGGMMASRTTCSGCRADDCGI